MSLRRAEERRRFTFHRLDDRERKEVLKVLGRELDREEVLLVVVHGGFVESKVFRDIDIAIFTGYKVPREEEIEFCEYLSETLTEKVGIRVDVRLLDYAPPSFRLSALSRCVVLVEREPMLRTSLLRAARQELEDLESKIRRLTGGGLFR